MVHLLADPLRDLRGSGWLREQRQAQLVRHGLSRRQRDVATTTRRERWMEWVYGREKKIFWQRKKTGRNTLHMFVPCRECSHRNLYTMISLCRMVGIGGITPFYGHGFGVRHTPEYNQPQWRYSGDIMVYIYI